MEVAPGRSPISIAAASIFFACSLSKDKKKSFKEIADVVGVCKSTIEQSYKIMVPRAYELFPKDIQQRIKNNSTNW